MLSEAIGGAGIGVVWGWLVANAAAVSSLRLRDILTMLIATGVLIDLGLVTLQRATVAVFVVSVIVVFVANVLLRELIDRRVAQEPWTI